MWTPRFAASRGAPHQAKWPGPRPVGRAAMRKRGEMVERSFAHVLLRGRENLRKCYLIHVAGFNLGFLMRALFGCGSPRPAAAARQAFLFIVQTKNALICLFIGRRDGQTGAMLLAFSSGPA